jgi:hypothetical protein
MPDIELTGEPTNPSPVIRIPRDDAMAPVRADEVVVRRDRLEDWDGTLREVASQIEAWFDDNESGRVRVGYTTAGNLAMVLMDTAKEIAEFLAPAATGSEGGSK